MEAIIKASDNLALIMEKVLKQINIMVGFARQKEAFLISADVEGLNELLEKEEEVALELREMEAELKQHAEVLASSLGISDENIELRTLIDLTEESLGRGRLSNLRNEMIESISQLSIYNDHVKELLNFQLDYVDLMLNLLVVPKSKHHSYNVQGYKEDEARNPSILEYRA